MRGEPGHVTETSSMEPQPPRATFSTASPICYTLSSTRWDRATNTRTETSPITLQSPFHTSESRHRSSQTLSPLIHSRKAVSQNQTSAKSRIFLILISALSRSIWQWGEGQTFCWPALAGGIPRCPDSVVRNVILYIDTATTELGWPFLECTTGWGCICLGNWRPRSPIPAPSLHPITQTITRLEGYFWPCSMSPSEVGAMKH